MYVDDLIYIIIAKKDEQQTVPIINKLWHTITYVYAHKCVHDIYAVCVIGVLILSGAFALGI